MQMFPSNEAGYTPLSQSANSGMSTTTLYFLIMGAVVLVLFIVLFFRTVKAIEAIISMDKNVKTMVDRTENSGSTAKDI